MDPPVDKCLMNLLYKTFLYRPEDEDPAVKPMFINLKNGILLLDSDTPQLIDHTDSMEFFTTVQVPTPYDPEAKPKLWIETLMDIFPDDPAKIAVLQQFVGYLLYPKILFPAVMMQVGKAGAGKSTLQQVLTQLIGPQNVSHVSLGQMEKQFGAAQIMNKLLNTCAETETAPLESTTFKQISASDRVSLDRKHAEHVVGRPIAKHLISTNTMPRFNEKGEAIYRRLLIIKFVHAFSKEDKDVHRADQLCEPDEMAGILNWAIEGLEIVLKDNQGKFNAVPASCEADMSEFKKVQEPVIEYVEDSGNVILGPDCHVGRRECYRDYVEWCEGPAKKRPVGEKRFFARIEELYNVSTGRVDTKKKWIGIGLVYQPES